MSKQMKTSKTETAKGLACTAQCERQHVDASSICPVRPRKGFLRKRVSHDPKFTLKLGACVAFKSLILSEHQQAPEAQGNTR